MRNNTPSKVLTLVGAAGCALLLAACNPSQEGTGSLTMQLTDAAVDSAEKVNVHFTGISLKHENSSPRRIDFDEPRDIDLLSLQGDAFDTLLEDETVTAGRYQWVRLHVEAEKGGDKSFIELDDGTKHSLYVPSGSQTGLKLVSGFDVPVDGSASFTIDFDLRKSVINPQSGDDYFLKPALRLVDNSQIGHINGTVRPDDFAACENEGYAVYAYDGADVDPVDVNINRDDDEINPLTTALVHYQDDQYEYSIGFLTEGEYTLAFTCEAGNDDPEEDDNLDFVAEKNVTVTAGETTEANFEASNE